MRQLALLVFFLYGCAYCPAQELRFAMPLKGTPGKDFFIDYYVDHDSTSGARDVFCGSQTYNGHNGTDLLLRGFKTMDSGVVVYAAAEGRVFETDDGHYDRSKRWVSGGLGNYVAIIHNGGICTYYGHMMKQSLLVKQGDSVHSGQPIGKVGSSGYSYYPHLHFEVTSRSGNFIDPFAGICGGRKSSMWIDQPLPDTAVYAIDNGFIPYVPGLDSLQERYKVTDTFYCRKDPVVCFWVLMHGLHKEDRIHVEWLKPDGRMWSEYNFEWKDNWWHSYSWPWVKMPSIKGKWLAKYYVNNVLMASRHFYVL